MSKDYMDEVSYKVPIKNLYRVQKAQINHEGCRYQVFLLKITDEKLRALYNDNTHIMQVWTLSGEIVYQRLFRCGLEEFGDVQDPILDW